MKKGIVGIIMVLGLALVLVSGCGGAKSPSTPKPAPGPAASGGLLTDGSFETVGAAGTDLSPTSVPWFEDNGATGTLVTDTTTDTVHGGAYACKVERPETWSAVSTDITSILIENGPGKYHVQFYVKLSQGGDSMQPVISLWTPDWAANYPESNPLTDVNSTDWTLVQGDINLSFSTNPADPDYLTKAYLSFTGATSKVPVFVDDFSMTKVD